MSEIETEVKIAVHRGSKEIVLLGQTVNSYGLDLTPRVSFVKLLERIAAISGVERIRFTSPHPQEIRKDFIEFVSTCPKMAQHVHMPLQSGSDRILSLMNRNYRRSKYLNIIQALKSRVPDIAVTTDIIVGFPGETEEDFQQTLEMMDLVQFDQSYSYAFSARPGTAAASMQEFLTQEEKLERLQVLLKHQEQIMAKRLAGWVGREVEVLVDGRNRHDETCFQGRISQNFIFNFTEPLDQPGIALGSLVRAKVLGHKRYTLFGALAG
jgi:tRNA-2-methylthio-N6-dimethylallyladenosine synthase